MAPEGAVCNAVCHSAAPGGGAPKKLAAEVGSAAQALFCERGTPRKGGSSVPFVSRDRFEPFAQGGCCAGRRVASLIEINSDRAAAWFTRRRKKRLLLNY